MISNTEVLIEYPDCPNCRGRGRVIAMWDFLGLDPTLTTQPGAPNFLNVHVARQSVVPPRMPEVDSATPRSMQTEYHFGTPDSHASRDIDPPWVTHGLRTRGSNYMMVLPSTYLDASEWARAGLQEDVLEDSEESTVYHIDTRLPDGRPSPLVDPGSVGNLGGDRWARDCARAAINAGRRPSENQRARPVNVTGVGHGSQECSHNCKLPVMLRRFDGPHTEGTFEAPIVPNSDLPGLLGLQSMRNARAVLDFTTLRLHLCGPADPTVQLHPGSESYVPA